MRKHRALSKLVTCILALAMVASLLPSTVTALEDDDPASGLVSLTGNAKITDYYIENESWNYNGNGDPIRTVETTTAGRIFDGNFMKDHTELFAADSGWVGKSWSDTEGGRGLFLNIFRGTSRAITADLGGLYNIRQIDASIGISDTDVRERDKESYGIDAVPYMDFYLSENGEDFYLAAHVTEITGREQVGYALDGGHLAEKNLNFNAKYIKIVFPVNVWVFMDEVSILGSTTPAAEPDDLESGEKFGTDLGAVNEWPTTQMSGGIKHDFLAYEGWGRYGKDLLPTKKTVKDFRAVVALVDQDGTPYDWLYDSVTFMGHGWASDETLMLLNSSYPDNRLAGKKEWIEWLDDAFDDPDNDTDGETNIDALDKAVGEIKSELTPNTLNKLTEEDISGHTVAAKIPVYPAICSQSDWGELQAGDKYVNVTVNGKDVKVEVTTLDEAKHLDFTLDGHDKDINKTLSDRASAYLWYMEEAVRRFEAKGYENIYLDGFYFFEEQVNIANDKYAEQSIKAYNMVLDLVGDGKYSSYWIPYYTVNGFKIWRDLGFDYAVMQPNGYGYGQDRMDNAADQAKKYGLGIEMEWMGSNKAGYVETFDRYLNTGVSKEYRNAPQAWYWGTDGLSEVAYDKGTLHDVYFKVYNYIKGNAVSATVELPKESTDDPSGEGGKLELTEDMMTIGFLGKPNADGETNLAKINAAKGVLIDGIYSNKYDPINNGACIGFNYGWEGAYSADAYNKGWGDSGYFVQFDLGGQYPIQDITMNFITYVSASVGGPREFKILTSGDGEKWTEAKLNEVKETPCSSTGQMNRLYSASLNGAAAGFVRFEFKLDKQNENNTYAFICFDEITIDAATKGRPLVEITEDMLTLGFLGKPNAEGLKGLETLNGLIGKLLDGYTAPTYDNSFNKPDSTYLSFLRTWEDIPEGGKEYANDGYFLEADLGQICDVTSLSLDFVAGADLNGTRNAGIGAPAGLVVKASNDGESWTALNVEPEVSMLYPYHYEKQTYTFTTNIAARYVRFEFVREANTAAGTTYSFVMFDEVEIKAAASDAAGPIALTGDMVSVGLAGEPNAAGVTGLESANKITAVLVDGDMPAGYNSVNAAGSSFVGFSRIWEGTQQTGTFDDGFLNSGNYITVDLGEDYNITGAAIDFLVGKILPEKTRRNSGIGEPATPVLQLSSDGETWTDAGKMKVSITGSGNYEKFLYTIDTVGSARYVRFAFSRLVLDPEVYNGTDTWLMIDEVSVNGARPAAAAPETPDTPDVDENRLTRDAEITQWALSDTTWHYNNNQSLPLVEEVEEKSRDRLIDGVYARDYPERFTNEAKWVGKSWDDLSSGRGLYINAYHGGERDIIVDLGGLYNITEVGMSMGISDPTRVTLRGEESYGIYAPNTLKIALSEDGESFYNIGELTEVERESLGYSLDAGVMRFTGLNYNARYIRLVFDVEVFVFPDELIVEGSRTPSGDADDLTKLEKFGEEKNIVNTWPTYEESKQIHHDYLAYQGWGTVNGAITEIFRTVKDMRAVAAYIDNEGNPLDWLYDSITFMGHGWTKDKSTYLLNSSVPNGPYADREDWEAQLDHTFNYKDNGDPTGVDALEEAMRQLKGELRPSGLNGLTQEEINNHRIAIKIPVYPAVPVQDKWGSLKAGEKYVTVTRDDEGKLSYTVSVLEEDRVLDFTLQGHGGDVDATLSDRASVFLWYMEEVVDVFEAKNYQHIYLDGFYYFEEKASIASDRIIYDTIRVYNMMVDEVGEKYSSYWIPFYTAEGYRDWASYGFDYAVMQPNGYNYDQKRMDTAASLAKKYGLGIEMEWMGNKPGYVDTFRSYLQTGISTGYQAAPQAWYWGTWDFTNMAYNEGTGEGLRDIYDYTYKYIKGFNNIDAELDTVRLEGGDLTVGLIGEMNDTGKAKLEEIGALKGKLVDGAYGGGYKYNMNTAGGPYLGFQRGWEAGDTATTFLNSGYYVTADLGTAHELSRASIDFVVCDGPGMGGPEGLKLLISNDGENWTEVGAFAEPDVTLAADDTRFEKHLYTMKLEGLTARFVRFEFKRAIQESKNEPYTFIMLDELTVCGTAVVTQSAPGPVFPANPVTPAAPGTSEDPGAEIPDEETPLAPDPGTPEEPGTEIPDDDVPLDSGEDVDKDDTPATGDDSLPMPLLIAVMALSLAAFAATCLIPGRKRR